MHIVSYILEGSIEFGFSDVADPLDPLVPEREKDACVNLDGLRKRFTLCAKSGTATRVAGLRVAVDYADGGHESLDCGADFACFAVGDPVMVFHGHDGRCKRLLNTTLKIYCLSYENNLDRLRPKLLYHNLLTPNKEGKLHMYQ